MKKISWDDLYMTMVYLIAMKSKDESSHIGAVVVGPDNEVRSVGYNSFPRGINDNLAERQERPEKYYWFSHAEVNTINNAALIGIPLKNCKMYTNGIPCTNCARSIINSGIKEVIVDKCWDDNNVDIWKEQAKISSVMFKEAGVKIRFCDMELLNVCRFRRGEKL
jgi:dCMP deaminase